MVEPAGVAVAAALARLHPGPVPRHVGWLEYVQEPQTEAELAALRRSVARGAPYGGANWVKQTAAALGLESSLNRPGRPTKRGSAEPEGEGLFGEKQP